MMVRHSDLQRYCGVLHRCGAVVRVPVSDATSVLQGGHPLVSMCGVCGNACRQHIQRDTNRRKDETVEKQLR